MRSAVRALCAASLLGGCEELVHPTANPELQILDLELSPGVTGSTCGDPDCPGCLSPKFQTDIADYQLVASDGAAICVAVIPTASRGSDDSKLLELSVALAGGQPMRSSCGPSSCETALSFTVSAGSFPIQISVSAIDLVTHGIDFDSSAYTITGLTTP